MPPSYITFKNPSDGETALHIIAETSRDLASAATYATLTALFKAGADPNMPNNRGATALHKLCNREAPAAGWAATSGVSSGSRMSARDLVELFLKYGARLDLPAGQGGPMPLLCAVVRRRCVYFQHITVTTHPKPAHNLTRAPSHMLFICTPQPDARGVADHARRVANDR